MKYVIIGAGPAGLGAGWQLEKNGQDFLILEKENYLGGLSTSFKDKVGFYWDLGGHVLFDNQSQLAKLSKNLLKNKISVYKRKASIFLDNKLISYPFQDNYLADKSFNKSLSPKNFKQWLYQTFGQRQAEVFFIPQNQKSWRFPLEQMSFGWIEKRIKLPQDKTKNWGANAQFLYPKIGGIGLLWQMISQKFQNKIKFNCEVLKIDEQKKEIILQDKKIKYQYLINTMPLNLLSQKLQDKKIKFLSGKIEYNSGLIIGLGIKGRLKTDQHWLYFPQKNLPFFRIVFNSNFSQLRKNYCALTLEITNGQYHDEINNLNLFDGKIISRFEKKIPYFYPIPTLDRDEILEKINKYLQDKQIYSIGRFGAWKYESGNMDDAFGQGMKVILDI